MAYLVAIVLGLFVIGFAKAVGLDRDRAFYPTVLVVVATYYGLFAVMGGSAKAIMMEAAAAVLFFAATVIGFRRNLWIVAAGLVAHGFFDAIHDRVIDNPGMPEWWPVFCGTIDVILGAGLAWLLLRNSLSATIVTVNVQIAAVAQALRDLRLTRQPPQLRQGHLDRHRQGRRSILE